MLISSLCLLYRHMKGENVSQIANYFYNLSIMPTQKQKIIAEGNLTELERVILTSFKEDMIKFVKAKPERFDELVELSLSNKQPVSWRANSVLNSLIKKNDKRLTNKIDKVLKLIPKSNDSNRRELLKLLMKMGIPESKQSEFIDVCINLWVDVDIKPSVRCYAFRILIDYAKQYPELSQELTPLTKDIYMDTLSDGIRRSLENRMQQSGAFE